MVQNRRCRLRKILPCPVCGKRLTDTEDNVNSKVIPTKALSNDKFKNLVPDYYMKCWNCGNDIAIKKVS